MGVDCESVAPTDVAPRFRPGVDQFARHGLAGEAVLIARQLNVWSVPWAPYPMRISGMS